MWVGEKGGKSVSGKGGGRGREFKRAGMEEKREQETGAERGGRICDLIFR